MTPEEKLIEILRSCVKEFNTGWSEYSTRNRILNAMPEESEDLCARKGIYGYISCDCCDCKGAKTEITKQVIGEFFSWEFSGAEEKRIHKRMIDWLDQRGEG